MRSLLSILLLSLLLSFSNAVSAQLQTESVIGSMVWVRNDDGFIELRPAAQKAENTRLVAIALDLTLGLFGMHRLYLGTDIRVPIGYTLTFGGGGVLWLVDLAMLVGAPDIESFKNNPHFFMWIPMKK